MEQPQDNSTYFIKEEIDKSTDITKIIMGIYSQSKSYINRFQKDEHLNFQQIRHLALCMALFQHIYIHI